MSGKRVYLICAAALLLLGLSAAPLSAATLELEKKIPLGKVSGRIDHFAFDRDGHRLFLAELGNDSVSVIDTQTGAVVHRITGLKEPQGVGYAAGSIFVANAGDGAVQIFNGTDFTPRTKIDLKDDADNVRVDAVTNQVVVGYGSGGLAIVDGKTFVKKTQIALKDHPESFQLDPVGARAFVNVPDAHEVAVLDLTAGKQVASWSAPGLHSNFPMALRSDGKQLLVAYRNPARLVMFDTTSGTVLSNISICGDADDVFINEKRGQAYVSCGEGVIDILNVGAATLTPSARVATVRGARTSYFDPETDQLYLAVRASSGEPAAVWVFKPQ